MAKRSKEVRKEPVDFHINDETMLETGKPVDFSFKKYKNLSGVGIEGARASRIGQLPVKSDDQKFLTRAVWLNNNKLTTIEGMDFFVDSVIQDPEQLAWIDFSFNYIKNVGDTLKKYTNLKIIYFHGNMISDLDEVMKFAEFKHLRSITFHGNPISKEPKYRSFIIAILPQIVNLDFSPILKSERLMPSPPEALRKLSISLGFDDDDDDAVNIKKFAKKEEPEPAPVEEAKETKEEKEEEQN